MGIYVNLGNSGFESARNSEYIDKSELIAVVSTTERPKSIRAALSASVRQNRWIRKPLRRII